MRRATNTSVGLFARAFRPGGPVIELGSRYLPGYAWLCDLRPYFLGSEYIGCDIRQGNGVDQIEDAQALSFKDESVGTVLMMDILEHLPHPKCGVAEAARVLKPDGLLALSVPFTYRLHGFPTDYWRFTASGIYTLLENYPNRTVFALGPRLKPAFIFSVAGRGGVVDFDQKTELFKELVQSAFQQSWLKGYTSVFKERARDFFGHVLGRSEMGVNFFDPDQGGGYLG